MKTYSTRHSLSIISLMMLASLILSSCNHKELYMMSNSKLTIAYDWSLASDANPAGMCVFFYSIEHPDVYYRFDFNNIKGGDIELPAGHYRLITYNNDTEVVKFSSTNNFESHIAYTRTGDLLEPLYGNGITSTAASYNGERVMVTPDGLWGCHSIDIYVDENGVKYSLSRSGDEAKSEVDSNGHQTITLYPHDMLCHYSFEVRHVDNIEHISRISAALSGMAPSMNVSTEELSSEKVTLPVSAHVDNISNEVVGNFLTFGHDNSEDTSHKMIFYVVMDDGSKYEIKDSPNLDVTSQIDNAPDPRNVHIIIDNLKLPQPGTTGNGFSPTVDDWGVKEEDIKV